MLTQLLTPAIDYLHTMSQTVPLPIFTTVGAALEEIIAPIPSPLVMTLAGSLSASAGNAMLYLVYLAIIGSIAKTTASYVVYVVSDKAEDVVLSKFGKFVGVSHKEVEKFGAQLSGGWTDNLVMLALRAIPIIPTAPVSIIAGLLKLDVVTFLWTTLVGYGVRNYFYLYLGATSVGALESLNEGLDSFEKIGYLIIFVLLVILALYFYKKRQDDNIVHKLLKFLRIK
ncbi:VTT domain-containing protein [Candidatus Woesebacteria bacterium]|nr:VTT domain-containing protein [Candidatus Woesebacteria bacterium]